MKRKLSKLLGIGLTVALLISLLATASPALALSQPVVTIPAGDLEISKVNANYNLRFTLAQQLTANATKNDYIVITFPVGTVLAAVTATIQAGPGWTENTTGGIEYKNAAPADLNVGANWTIDATARTITWYADNTTGTDVYIGEGAEVRIDITAGITNPDAPGTYALTVHTNRETTPVTSNSFTLSTPTLTALPGIVTAYNSAGIAMKQDTKLDAAMVTAAGKDGRIEMTTGEYTAVAALNQEGVKVIGVGAVVFDSAVNIQAKGVTLENVTIKDKLAAGNVIAVNAAGTDSIITNVTIKAGPNAAAITNAAAGVKIVDCTIDAAAKIGVGSANGTTIENSTFTVKAGGTAIGSTAGGITVKGSTITGSSGIGVSITTGTAALEGNTFMTLNTAIQATGDSIVNAKNNVIDGCGAATADIVVNMGTTNTSSFTNNTVKNCNSKSYAFQVTAGVVNAQFNNIIDNTLNVKQTAGTANFRLNWWGSDAGPAATSIAGTVDKAAPLGALPTEGAGATTTTATLAGKTTALVDITFDGAVALAGASKLNTNPVVTTPPIRGTGSVIGYWDIYVDAGAATEAIVKIYAAGLNEYAIVYYGGGLSGLWTKCDVQDVNVASGYIWFKVTGTSTPSLADLKGTPFAVVIDKTLAAPNISTIAGGSPAVGAYDISTTPTFTWAPVVGVHHYEIALCEDPTFTIIEWAYNVNDPFYKATDALRYSTTYYWRVRGILDAASTAKTPWSTGIFTTEAEPVAETTTGEPIVVEAPTPEITVEIPPTKITVEPAAPAIPTYLLWIIVVVGAVLVIALIVLIVRTRRVA